MKIFNITRCTPGEETVSIGLTHDGERKVVIINRAQFLNWLDATDRLNCAIQVSDEFETSTGRFSKDDYFALCPTHLIVEHLYAYIVLTEEEYQPYLQDLTA